VQHVVRNVTAGVAAGARRLDTWVVVAAAIAVPLLATLQYRWLSDLGAARRSELRQSWAEAVARGAGAVNRELSGFYASALGAGQRDTDVGGVARALEGWRGGASMLGPLARVSLRERATARWRALPGATERRGLEAPERFASAVPEVAFSASWLAPPRPQALPGMAIALDRGAAVDAVLLTFDPGACERLLADLALRHFGGDGGVRLAIVEAAPTRRPICSDGPFEPGRAEEERAVIFRLQPAVRSPSRDTASAGSIGIAMSDDAGRAMWELTALPAPTLAGTVRRVQARNLWMAAGLELTLVVALAAMAAGARRARRRADAHVKFSAVVAHELRTPLAAIKVLAQNQAHGLVRRDDQIVQYGHAMAAEADRLHAFVERVLQFTGGRTASASARSGPVDFERVLAGALEPLRERIAASGVAVRSSVDAAARTTVGDEGALVLAVRNLIQNALDHAEGARTIVVAVGVRDRHVAIAVADDGVGVPPSECARVFEPFVRGSQTRRRGSPGHGLGLAIVRDVARAHGGRASYEAGNPGSVFTFTVPLRAAAADGVER
jgi:signal transduction histidine kinase